MIARRRKPVARPRLLPHPDELGWRRILDSRPAMSPHCTVAKQSERTVSLRVKCARPGFLVPPISWIIRPRRFRDLRLDALGTEIWHLCDGRHRLETIVDRFAEANGLTFHEARVSVMHYIHLLMERGALVVGLPPGTDDARTAGDL